jgi:quaternary ammonium compound-resistance protein SugE
MIDPDDRNRTRTATRRYFHGRILVMAWVVLVISGVFEAVWATALGKSEGFSRLGPSIVFGVALIISMAGLAFAMRTLPIGTSYAIWVGIGAGLTVGYAMVTGSESASIFKIVLILIIIGAVIGLKLAH